MKRKVMTVVGTRPELIKMSRVIARLDQVFDHVLVHTGQNYDDALSRVFFDDLGIRAPNHHLNVACERPMGTVAAVLEGVDAVIAAEQPNALLVYGDTNSGLCVLCAKRRKIPVFHMEAGNRCFDDRVPEEINRRVIDHVSDVNIVLTEHARRNLLAEGLPSDRIFKVGSHMGEVLLHQRQRIADSNVLDRLGLSAGQYFVVSLHREENVDEASRLLVLITTLDALARAYDMPVVVSTHPRTRARMSAGELTVTHPAVRFMSPFGFSDYVRLQQDAFCVVSDSGTITEETALLGLTSVSVRDAHERPEGVEAGTLIHTPLDVDRVLDAVRIVRQGRDHVSNKPSKVYDYDMPSPSEAIVRIVASYIDAVNERTWKVSLR